MFVKHLFEIQSRIEAGQTYAAIYADLKEDDGFTLSSSQFNRYIQKLITGGESERNVRSTIQNQAERDAPAPRNKGLVNDEQSKPQANFRQSMKQIREDVENTDWASLINQSNRSGQNP